MKSSHDIHAILSSEASRIPDELRRARGEQPSSWIDTVFREAQELPPKPKPNAWEEVDLSPGEPAFDLRGWRRGEVKSPPICIHDIRPPKRGRELLADCFRILFEIYLYSVQCNYRSWLTHAPLIDDRFPDAWAWNNLGNSAVKVDPIFPVLRYADRTPSASPIPNFIEGPSGRFEVNPEWSNAPYADEIYVLDGWLTDYYPAGEEFGSWRWVSIYDAEANPYLTWGYFRGILHSKTSLDLSKVARFRVRLP